MNGLEFKFAGHDFTALATGALYWRDQNLLCVSDLHLMKSDRIARREGRFVPPYETRDTLDRLRFDLDQTQAARVVCLGDSFDDLAGAAAMGEPDLRTLTQLQAGREWIWIEGNHDPGPIELGGTHRAEYTVADVTLRHIAEPEADSEISGHYHPKARIKSVSRPCFLFDATRMILPAYGTYTGGLRSDDAALNDLMGNPAFAILSGRSPLLIPMPR